jgi:hypothetical protein
MKDITIISIVLMSITLMSCKDYSVLPEPVEHDPLIPLSVGNYWLYQGYYLKPDDGSVNFPEHDKFGFIVHNPSSQLKNRVGSTNYQMSICGEDLLPVDDSNYLLYGGSKLIYQNENGFYYSGIIRKDTLVMSFNDLIFLYPAKKGESVSGHVFFYSPLGNGSNVPDEVITKYDCVSTDSLFTTPLGEFRCIVYKMAYADFEPLFRDEVYYFIKPGLGIVGTVEKVYLYSLNKYRYFKKYVLTDYKIK